MDYGLWTTREIFVGTLMENQSLGVIPPIQIKDMNRVIYRTVVSITFIISYKSYFCELIFV